MVTKWQEQYFKVKKTNREEGFEVNRKISGYVLHSTLSHLLVII